MIAPEHRDSFAEHAAPEAIEHQLRQAKAARRQAQRDIEWLAELAGRRAAEVVAGTWPSREERPYEGPKGEHSACAWNEVCKVFPDLRHEFVQPLAIDSCTCALHGPDPGCVVHHGRRARGPKPPPLGPDCICDGSGRTCPRHGAVI